MPKPNHELIALLLVAFVAAAGQDHMPVTQWDWWIYATKCMGAMAATYKAYYSTPKQ